MATFALAGCQLIMDDIDVDAGHEPALDASGQNADTSTATDAANAADAADLDANDAPEGDAQQAADSMVPAADAGADAMPAPVDSATPDADPSACDGAGSRVFFRDHDRDGYGDPGSFMIACKAPGGYVSTGEDCNDDNDSVNPGQEGFFGEGYALPDFEDVSFDYDCDGNETGGPGQDLANPQGCEGLVPCSGAGYVPAAGREVPRANDHCGSTTILTCGFLLICTGTPSATASPYVCH